MHERVFFANLPRGLDEIDAVIVMFVDARRDREIFGSKMMSSGGSRSFVRIS